MKFIALRSNIKEAISLIEIFLVESEQMIEDKIKTIGVK